MFGNIDVLTKIIDTVR